MAQLLRNTSCLAPSNGSKKLKSVMNHWALDPYEYSNKCLFNILICISMEFLGERAPKDCFSVITPLSLVATGNTSDLFTASFPMIISLDRIHYSWRNTANSEGELVFALVVVRDGETVSAVNAGADGDFYAPCKNVLWESVMTVFGNGNSSSPDGGQENVELMRRPLLKLLKGDSVHVSADLSGPSNVFMRVLTYWSIWK